MAPLSLHGPYGVADRYIPADIPESAETVCCWLLTAPRYHPSWTQYILAVVRLRDNVPGFPEAVHQFEGTTHEFMILALDPNWPVNLRLLASYRANGTMHYLMPPCVVHQFEATDTEMDEIAEACCHGITHGWLSPAPGDAPERMREGWLSTIIKSLAHLRGEQHAR